MIEKACVATIAVDEIGLIDCGIFQVPTVQGVYKYELVWPRRLTGDRCHIACVVQKTDEPFSAYMMVWIFSILVIVTVIGTIPRKPKGKRGLIQHMQRTIDRKDELLHHMSEKNRLLMTLHKRKKMISNSAAWAIYEENALK